MGEAEYFCNRKGYYYGTMPSVWKNVTVIKQRYVIYIIDRFTTEIPSGKSPWTKQNILSLVFKKSLTKFPRLKYSVWLQVKIMSSLRVGCG